MHPAYQSILGATELLAFAAASTQARDDRVERARRRLPPARGAGAARVHPRPALAGPHGPRALRWLVGGGARPDGRRRQDPGSPDGRARRGAARVLGPRPDRAPGHALRRPAGDHAAQAAAATAPAVALRASVAGGSPTYGSLVRHLEPDPGQRRGAAGADGRHGHPPPRGQGPAAAVLPVLHAAAHRRGGRGRSGDRRRHPGPRDRDGRGGRAAHRRHELRRRHDVGAGLGGRARHAGATASSSPQETGQTS